MMIVYRSRFLWRGELWFDNQPAPPARPVDWILHHQRARPLPGAKTRCFYTLLIDLSQSQDQLFAQLNENTAYKIRRARDRDKIVCESCAPQDPAVMRRFEEMYNAFAGVRGLRSLDRARLQSLAAAGLLDMSVAKDSHGRALVYHANYCDSYRATQLELPSLYRTFSQSAARNLSGRASRYLTWSDILRYKAQGLRYFDFGGWHLGSDPGMLKINDFKRGFGGQIVREYQCEQIVTLKGWLVLHAAKLIHQKKSGARRPQEPATCTQTELACAFGPVGHR